MPCGWESNRRSGVTLAMRHMELQSTAAAEVMATIPCIATTWDVSQHTAFIMTRASALGMCPMRARGRNAPLILEGVQRWRLKPDSNPLGQGHLTSCQPVASPFASLATTVKCRIECRRIMVDFYHAMLCIRGTSHGPVSVCICLCLSQAGVILK